MLIGATTETPRLKSTRRCSLAPKVYMLSGKLSTDDEVRMTLLRRALNDDKRGLGSRPVEDRR